MQTNPPPASESTAEPSENPPPPEIRSPKGDRRPTGKIAKLSRELRALINQQLDDGATYASIAENLEQHSVFLNAENISNWKESGYQNHLAAQARNDFVAHQLESATLLVNQGHNTTLAEAGIQTAVAQIFDLLARFDSLVLAETTSDSEKYLRLLNSLSRLSREVATLQKLRASAARDAKSPLLIADPDVSDRRRELILDAADDILGVKAYRRRNREPKT